MKKFAKRGFPVLLSLLLVFGSCLTAVAAGTVDSLNSSQLHDIVQYVSDNQASILDSWPYYFVQKETDDTIIIAFSNEPFKYSNGNYYFAGQSWFYRYRLSTEEFNQITGLNCSVGSYFLFQGQSYLDPSGLLFSSNHIRYLGLDDIFFQRTPVGILVPAAQLIQPEAVMMEVVGLLPLLIPFLVLVTGFWKGWQHLWMLLRRA